MVLFYDSWAILKHTLRTKQVLSFIPQEYLNCAVTDKSFLLSLDFCGSPLYWFIHCGIKKTEYNDISL